MLWYHYVVGRGYFYGDALIRKRAQSAIHSLPELNLNINFKAQNRKTKTDTNPIPDPNRYRRRCPDPNARIQKFYTLYRNTTKEFTQSYYKKSFAGVSGWGSLWATSTV